jgi:hypothetical protein
MHRLLQIVSGLGSPEEGSACKMAHHQDQRENPTKTCHLSLSCRDGKEMAVSLEDDHFLSEPAWNLAFPRSYLLIQTDLRLFVSEFNLFPLISPG